MLKFRLNLNLFINDQDVIITPAEIEEIDNVEIKLSNFKIHNLRIIRNSYIYFFLLHVSLLSLNARIGFLSVMLKQFSSVR